MLPPMTLPLGSRIAEFEINEVLGEGGFGVVYLATDLQLNRQVALKEYMPASLAVRRADHSIAPRSAEAQEAFDLGRRSFVNEARLLAQFEHPSLAKILRYWEEHGTAYIVMPFYEGLTLKNHLRQHPGPSEAWLRHMLAPLMDALAMLHASRCYHRDVAPDNILLLPEGRPLLLDFGAARQVIGAATQTLTAILKPGYAPIEQYGDSPGTRQGPWTDIYALSAVLYNAMTGKTPPPSVSRILDDALEPAGALSAGRYSASLLAAVGAGLRLRPEARPQSIAEFGALLDRPAASTREASMPASARFGPRVLDDATVAEVTSALGLQQRAAAAWPARKPASHAPARRKAIVGVAVAGLALLAAGATAWWLLRGAGGEGPPRAGSQAVEQASSPAELPRPAADAAPPTAVDAPPRTPALPSSVPRTEEPAQAKPATAPPKAATNAASAPAPRAARDKPPPSADEAACASLLQRASMGEDTPALRERLKSLNCR